MFDLIKSIKKKSGLDDMFGDTMAVPQSVQDVLQIKTAYPDVIFRLGKESYSKMFRFSDINYAVSSKVDKEDDFFKYSEILNSLENGVSSQITIVNCKIKNNKLLSRYDKSVNQNIYHKNTYNYSIISIALMDII